VVSPQARREQVALACQRGLSERRACGLLGIARSCLGYELRLPVKDAPVIADMKLLWAQYPRYGYRRIRIFLQRQGHQLGWHRTHRLWSRGWAAAAASATTPAHRQQPTAPVARTSRQRRLGL